MERIIEREKIDTALLPQSIASTNKTGFYLHLSSFRQIVFILLTAAIAAGKSAVIQLMQATDQNGTGAKVITSATVTIAPFVNAVSASIDLTSAANTDVVTVNGTSFTKAAAASGTDFSTAADLVTAINANVSNVKASASGNVVTVASIDGKADVNLGKTENAGTITLATVAGMGMVEVEPSDLDIENGFEYVAAKVTTDATIICSVQALRGRGRFTPDQIGESKIL